MLQSSRQKTERHVRFTWLSAASLVHVRDCVELVGGVEAGVGEPGAGQRHARHRAWRSVAWPRQRRAFNREKYTHVHSTPQYTTLVTIKWLNLIVHIKQLSIFMLYSTDSQSRG